MPVIRCQRAEHPLPASPKIARERNFRGGAFPPLFSSSKTGEARRGALMASNLEILLKGA
jgi:hypothetical protein